MGGGPDSTGPQTLVEVLTPGQRRRPAILLAGDADSAERYAPDYCSVLGVDATPCAVLPLDDELGALEDFTAIVVGGGHAPTYHHALFARAAEIRELVAGGVAYVGFSAGAMIAGDVAILGGHQVNGSSVCPEEWSEGLGEVTLAPGLGLVPFVIDVHAAQAGTLGRAHYVAERNPGWQVVALDENTALRVHGSSQQALGTGNVWRFTASLRGPVCLSRESA